MKLTIGFSTCPNDTFIFDALINGRIDTEGLEFEVKMADVEELNRYAFRNAIHITKISLHAFAYLSRNYVLLDSGSALGKNNGPLLIGKEKTTTSDLNTKKTAIPGKYTTANLLLSIAYPEIRIKEELLFSDIEGAIIDGIVDAGVIIHENRFTYERKGLIKIRDLGEYWEETTAMPIPLGGIIIQRSLPDHIKQTFNRLLMRSVEYALNNPEVSRQYVKNFAQEMDDEVIMQHIALYVNNYTLNLGKMGKMAIQTLFEKAQEKGVIPSQTNKLFLNE